MLQTQSGQTTKNITFTYDLNGNRASQSDSAAGSTTSYGYDQANRLVDYNNGADQYSYDGDGLRMRKTPRLLAPTNYTWAAAGGLPLLLSDGTANYLYGPGGRLVEQVQSSTPYYYHADQLGSIRALSTMSGTLAATYSYDPYGNVLSSTGTLYNPFRYAGEYRDSESGFYYLRARYYDPATQQFLTPDPLLKLAGMLRPYAYAEGSPLNGTDPTGLGCSQGGLPIEECEHQGSEWIGPAPYGAFPSVNGYEGTSENPPPANAVIPKPINSKYAGGTYYLTDPALAAKYPNGVPFNEEGYPDFSSYAKCEVKIKMQGNHTTDFTAADRAAAAAHLEPIPEDYTWHHVEDRTTMQQVPTDLHKAVRHTGGVALIKWLGLLP